jgi:hypothetical protein
MSKVQVQSTMNMSFMTDMGGVGKKGKRSEQDQSTSSGKVI